LNEKWLCCSLVNAVFSFRRRSMVAVSRQQLRAYLVHVIADSFDSGACKARWLH
jgi:hypothetical protein